MCVAISLVFSFNLIYIICISSDLIICWNGSEHQQLSVQPVFSNNNVFSIKVLNKKDNILCLFGLFIIIMYQCMSVGTLTLGQGDTELISFKM